MKQWKFLGTTAFVALVAGNAALAEVTPQEVWDNWKSLAESYGQTITVEDEAEDGDALVVTGVEITSATEGAEADATLSIDELTFTDNGDGSVDVTLSETSTLAIRAAGEEGKADTLTTLDIVTPGLVITASGEASETRYDYEGPTVSVKLAGVEGPDADTPKDLKAEVNLTALAGNYLVAGETDKTITSSMSAEGIAMVLFGTNPEDGSKIDAKVNLAGLSGQSTSKMVGDMAEMAAALKAGTSIQGDMAYQSASIEMAVTEAEGETKINATNAGGNLAFAMDAAKLSYGGTAKDASFTISGAQIPVPQVNLAYKEGAFNFVMPVSKSDTPAEFAFLTKIVDLTISDEIWAMLDPTAQLPRDPMTVILDTKGTAKLSVDLMDSAAMAALGQGAPGELHSLDINALQVKLAGADITGQGALTFDNTDLTTYGGMPAPTGKVDLKATGLNGLLDKLMAMGLVPEDQMMGARMMLGMFAKVVEGEPDTMTSSLEFKDKHFFANGMQLQ